MSSWLARSLANSLRLDDDGGDDDQFENDVASTHHRDPPPSSPTNRQHHNHENEEAQSEEAQERGVKDDLSELKETLARQLWGVASFLAPPPSPSHRESEQSDQFDSGDEEEPSDREHFGEMSRIATNSVAGGAEGNGRMEEFYYDYGHTVGVTEEVLAFARNIAMHPETWLDFPLDAEEDLDDFDMSDAQKEHALAILRLAPRLTALKIELCPCHMNESYFWKVYFVLLHPRLNKHDAEALSTPQVVAARAMWMQELQKQTKAEPEWFGRSTSYLKESDDVLREDLLASPKNAYSEIRPFRTFAFEPTTSSMTTDYETEKHPIVNYDMQIIDKSVIEETPLTRTEDKGLVVGPSSKILLQNYEDDDDDYEWPEDDGSDLGGYSGTAVRMGNEEDISFSDLEDDDCCVPMKSKIQLAANNL